MRRLWIIGLLLLAIAATSCAAPAATPTPVPLTSKPAATASEATKAPELTGKLRLAGSTSVQPLAEKLGPAFMAKHPKVTIEVAGGGSGAGVKGAGEGAVEIGMTSRDLTDADRTTYEDLKQYIIAKDGIAIVANPSVNVKSITKAQASDIFSGKITNWKEVGGADRAILVVSREEGSGTRDGFQSMVMAKDAKITEKAILQTSNGAVLKTVAQSPDAVGYLSIGFVDSGVKSLQLDGVDATEANASAGTYPVVRPFNLLTKGDASGLTKAFIDWVLSPEGQAIVKAEKYIAVR